MYKPLFNQVLVEIDDNDAKWGKGNDDSLGGDTFREGIVKEIGSIIVTREYPYLTGEEMVKELTELVDKAVIWNEGHEAGKVFDHDEKKYALIYWWDLVGVKDGKQ